VSHKGIRLLIEDTSKSLGDDIQFTYARTSDFNILSDKRYPFISLDLLNAAASFTVNNVSNYSKIWSAQMAFYQLDKEDSTQEDYAKILDFTDHLVDSFVTKLNFFSNNDEIIIQGIGQTPFIKATADILTGHLLSFQIIVPDNWDYCANGC
jgi:hypothetical protein